MIVDKVEEVVQCMIKITIERKKIMELSNKELGKKAGLSTSYISRFINGRVKDPYLRDMIALANALDFRFTISIE